MKICLLTYDAPHKKTAQIFHALLNRGFEYIDLMLMPFSKRPEREVALAHRPYQFEGPDPRSLVKSSGGKLVLYEDWKCVINDYDVFLVCGSNLIDREFANCGKILNSHAGLIPTSRGLDSFKWAIFHQKEVGNTLHFINDEADSGEVIYHLPTPLYQGDEIRTFADRHYSNEIWLLSNFDSLLDRRRILVSLDEVSDPTRRMPIDVEAEMLQRFDDYKSKFAL